MRNEPKLLCLVTLLCAAALPAVAQAQQPTAKMQEKIDDLIRKTVREKFGKVVAVEGRLGVRNSNGPQGAPYQRYYLENGFTVFVTGWHVGEPVVTVSEKKADPKSYTVSRFLAAAAKREKKAAKSEPKAPPKTKVAKPADEKAKA